MSLVVVTRLTITMILLRKENKVHLQGICPKCGSRELKYGDSRLDTADEYYFEYHCNSCGFDGREWYALRFMEHTTTSGETVGEPGKANQKD